MARKRPDADLSDQLRDIFRRKPSAYAIARAAEVDPATVQRFLDGERDMTTGTLDKIGRALGLKVIETGRGMVPDGPPRSRRRPVE